ncbi:Veg family protein [Hydrogenispora ethanolica]|uniref:Veg family protein n=1 Tax=Hydrogenispora ethanolica TaxID=1082276 RepID=UPI00312050A8
MNHLEEVGVLDRIREDLGGFVGEAIRIRANRGRKKIFEVEGVLEQTYPKVFVVRFKERQIERRVSYSYADLLTQAVELTVGENRIGTSPQP